MPPRTSSPNQLVEPARRTGSPNQRARVNESSISAAASLSLDLMSKIHIPTPLRQYVGKQSTVDVKAATVGEAITALVAQHPELRRHLYTEEGKLRAFVNLYLNDEDIRYLQKEATEL